ncbi:MAG: HEPN domain-containing protein [Prevotellaceae bacterium]|jgi:uncharacterized protein (UPF0332 family)|nr:HEPN domain-containing protein [Prevotellaceae bacterium]
MTLSSQERDAIVAYRVEKAKETIKEVDGIVSMGYWNNAANRLYYSVYYIVSALMVKNGFRTNTHSGVRNLFTLHFVKTGLVNKESMRLYSHLFDFRLKSDYDDFFDLEEKDILPLIEEAKVFIHEIEQLINEQ